MNCPDERPPRRFAVLDMISFGSDRLKNIAAINHTNPTTNPLVISPCEIFNRTAAVTMTIQITETHHGAIKPSPMRPIVMIIAVRIIFFDFILEKYESF